MGAPGRALRPAAFLRSGVSRLPSASFAFVMATGIVSEALRRDGVAGLSLVLVWLALAGLAALCAAVVWQWALAPARIRHGLRDPAQTFGYFTVIAAFNVVAARLHGVGPAGVTWFLAAVAFLLWLGLGYGIPAAVMLRRAGPSAAEAADGSWFLWAVATQSVAIAAGELADTSRGFAVAAVAFWGIGVMLYLILTMLITLRLLATSAVPSALSPSYWIYMGATAITASAGSVILAIADPGPVIVDFRPVIAGLTFVLWSFGLWWIPMLVVFGIWRHGVHKVPLRYDTSLWSIVFPLGMLATASSQFGSVEHLPFMVQIGRIGALVAFAAWLAVALSGVGALARAWRRRGAPATRTT